MKARRHNTERNGKPVGCDKNTMIVTVGYNHVETPKQETPTLPCRAHSINMSHTEGFLVCELPTKDHMII